MTFEKAIENLKKGKRIRRKSWKKLAIALDGERLTTYHLKGDEWKQTNGKEPFFRTDAIRAEDWEVVND